MSFTYQISSATLALLLPAEQAVRIVHRSRLISSYRYLGQVWLQKNYYTVTIISSDGRTERQEDIFCGSSFFSFLSK